MTETARIGNYRINLSIGIVGMAIACYGNLLPFSTAQQLCFLIGAIILFLSAALEKQLFFIVLQVIIGSGAAIAFAPISTALKAAVPILLSIGAMGYFYQQNKPRDKLMLFGMVSIAFLAAGYAITYPILYALGSAMLIIYSSLSFRRGVKIALLWVILNMVFTLTALINLAK